jgi:hypothetical protein
MGESAALGTLSIYVTFTVFGRLADIIGHNLILLKSYVLSRLKNLYIYCIKILLVHCQSIVGLYCHINATSTCDLITGMAVVLRQ